MRNIQNRSKMSNGYMVGHERVIAVLSQFARLGFRKTSMDDIARASGLSRQTVYNRYGSKEGAFEWMLEAFLHQILENSVFVLNKKDGDPDTILLMAYQRWIGDHIEIFSGTEHGMALIDRAIQFSKETTSDAEQAFMNAVSDFLVEQKISQTPALAAELTFALSMAAKGIMIKSKTPQEFATAMDRVITVII